MAVVLCNCHTVCFLVTKRSISSTSSTVTRLLVPPRPPPLPLLNISSREAAAVLGPTWLPVIACKMVITVMSKSWKSIFIWFEFQILLPLPFFKFLIVASMIF